MERNNLRLPQFLQKTDTLTAAMSQKELREFIHEVARTWPESRREAFLSLLKVYSGDGESVDHQKSLNDGYDLLVSEINDIKERLQSIHEGERCLDSEYNEEWDDWYNSDVDEILFTDPQNILVDVNTAISLIHKCIDLDAYKEGAELANILSVLDVRAEGDYCDFDGSLLGIHDLYEASLLSGDFDIFVKECLYLTYMGNHLTERADQIFCMIFNLRSSHVCLEDVLQTGNRELPEFDEFLKLWIDYLGGQRGKRAGELLKEAQTMVVDDSSLLEHARKYVGTHPSLYRQLLKMKRNAGEDEEMMEIGLEALDKIPVSYLLRGEIALLTAFYAEKIGAFDIAEKSWLEAFRSDTSTVNYMRLRFLTRHWEQYEAEVRGIMDQLFQNKQEDSVYSVYDSEDFRENSISKSEYCAMLFFEQEFGQMKKIGMNMKEPLGWSSTFMKEGISLMLLLLYSAEDLPCGLQTMQRRALLACQFHAEEFYQGTDQISQKSDEESFGELLREWKEDVHFSEEDKVKWINDMKKWIRLRTQGIMDYNRRNYYGECAGFIAALGEVMESLGHIGAKAKLMEEYRSAYPRRRAFHDELRRYGMRK